MLADRAGLAGGADVRAVGAELAAHDRGAACDLRLLDTRPITAGVLIGLLTVKPQLGILFPFLLIASGRWKVFFMAAVTAIALCSRSIAIGGLDGWQDYITKALPLQREVLQDAAGTAMPFQPSIFMNIRGVVGNHIGEIIQFAFTLAAVAAVRWRSATGATPIRGCCKHCSSPARSRPRPIWAPTICCR